MTEETKDTLAELKKKVAELEKELGAKDEVIDEMKKKEEGWLVFCPNPTYNGETDGIDFTDGVAFVPKNRVFPKYKVGMPEEKIIRSSAEGARIPYEEQKAQFEASASIPSSQRQVDALVKDFGYKAEYFTKDQQDELKKRISARAQERAEVEAKLGTREQMIEKLIGRHRF